MNQKLQTAWPRSIHFTKPDRPRRRLTEVMEKSLLVLLVSTVIAQSAAKSEGPGSCPGQAAFQPSTVKSFVVRRPFGRFDTSGNLSYLVPRNYEDVGVVFRWFPGGESSPFDYHPGNNVSRSLLFRNLTIVCHGLPRRMAASANALVHALLNHQNGSVVELLWNVGDCGDDEAAMGGTADIYYCPKHATLSDSHWYQQAAGDSRLVARVAARTLVGLANDHDYDLEKIHFIGFGIGAHVGRVCAAEVQSAGFTLGRLTMLDPTAPLFSSTGVVRYNVRNATRIDAVHTSGLHPCGLGMGGAVGAFNVYVNGGECQPECSEDGRNCDSICSHLAALTYYAQSITNYLDATGRPLPGYWISKDDRNVADVHVKTLVSPNTSVGKGPSPSGTPSVSSANSVVVAVVFLTARAVACALVNTRCRC